MTPLSPFALALLAAAREVSPERGPWSVEDKVFGQTFLLGRSFVLSCPSGELRVGLVRRMWSTSIHIETWPRGWREFVGELYGLFMLGHCDAQELWMRRHKIGHYVDTNDADEEDVGDGA